jgi:hypothetical protein
VERIDILFSDVVMPGGMNGSQPGITTSENRMSMRSTPVRCSRASAALRATTTR